MPSVAYVRSSSLTLALLMMASGACSGSSASKPASSPVPEAVETTSSPAPREIKLDDGSYVELSAGIESGFAHCCGDDQYRMEIECSDGLLRCYRRTGQRWEQTYGKYCKAALDQQCYEQTCVRVCEAYWEVGATRWQEVMGN